MKKNVLFVFVFLLCISAYSQNRQGKFFAGMSTTLSSIGTGPELVGINFSTNTVKVGPTNAYENKQTGFNIVPKLGYFFTEYISAGLDLNFSYKSFEAGNTDELQKSIFSSAGIFGRFYFPSEKVYPFLEIDGSLGKAKVEYEPIPYYLTNSVVYSSFYKLGVGLGVGVPVGDVIIIDFVTGYDFVTERTNEDLYGMEVKSNTNTFGLEIGLMFIFGN